MVRWSMVIVVAREMKANANDATMIDDDGGDGGGGQCADHHRWSLLGLVSH